MTVTFSNISAQPTTKNAAMAEIDESKLVISSHTSSGNSTVTVYSFADGDPADNTSVVVRREYVPNQDQTRLSVRLVTNVEDDTLDVPLVGQYEAVLAWNFPGHFSIDVGQMAAMTESLFGLAHGAYDGTTGVPDLSPVTLLNFGVSHDLWG